MCDVMSASGKCDEEKQRRIRGSALRGDGKRWGLRRVRAAMYRHPEGKCPRKCGR